MAKTEIETEAKLKQWIANPSPAVFQGVDLTGYDEQVALLELDGCVFLGCTAGPLVSEKAAQSHCVVFPRPTDLEFDPFRASLYAPDDLYDKFDPENPVTSYQASRDYRIYDVYLHSTDLDLVLMQRLHDFSIADALGDLLDTPVSNKKRPTVRHNTVAIMGGHDVSRADALYKRIADLAFGLASQGYLVATGGGPGLMEAANLGAYCAGFKDGSKQIAAVIDAVKDAPLYNHPLWLAKSFAAWRAMGKPDDPTRSRNLGVPTWFYGFEPPNVFATDIAKYFENSVREEGLLGIAYAGVIFAEGNAGTTQEIFQDACQNYYRTYDKVKSPMILLGSAYWNPGSGVLHHAGDKRKPLYPLLEKLATEKGFSDYLLLTDDAERVLDFIDRHPPIP